MPIKTPKKLIEVALPLDDINTAAAKEKSIRHGHPSTLHLWWARRPLAAARAVLFAQLVNDPGGERGWQRYSSQTKEDARREREALFDIIRDLVKWENTNNETVLERARAAIRKSWRETCEMNKGRPGFDPDKLPAFHDPFAGGGAIPLEAQRLGLEAYASDLNPVAVMINKAMIEIPPKFAGRPPVNPESREDKALFEKDWSGAKGLAEDVRYYGKWMRERAFEKIGHLYPKVKITKEMAEQRDDLKAFVGKELTVIAWLWARTVKCPNPACGCRMPLVKSFLLSSKIRKKVWIEPEIDTSISPQSINFHVKTGDPSEKEESDAKSGTGYINEKGKKVQATFRCLCCNHPVKAEYIDGQANDGKMGTQLLTVVADGGRQRLYIEPSNAGIETVIPEVEKFFNNPALQATLPKQKCKGTFASNAQGRRYGFYVFKDYFTPRQLVALTNYSDLVMLVRDNVVNDAKKSGIIDDGGGLGGGGTSATAYGDAVAAYLGMAVSRLSDICNSLCRWESSKTQVRNLFGRQAIPMMWDFAETGLFSNAAGDFATTLESMLRFIERQQNGNGGVAFQADAASQESRKHIERLSGRVGSNSVDSAGGDKPRPYKLEDTSRRDGLYARPDVVSEESFQDQITGNIISTDPPYYGNVGYADLSDFFYVWMRRCLRPIFPDLFAGMSVPKSEELIASSYRHGNKEGAETFFLSGMTKAIHNMAEQAHPAFPLTIYYAFKQDANTASTGWETFLAAVISAGLSITGTWPMRTELGNRMVSRGTNALASSIVLVCRKRPKNAPTVSRRQFQKELKTTFPEALESMIWGSKGISPIAPVDLAQAAIGPGMAVFSKYSAVLEADGSPMRVHDALVQINREIDEYFNTAEGDLDADSRFCIDWFQEYGFKPGEFGRADVLARAKGTSVDAVAKAGVAESGGGKVRLLTFGDYPESWNPDKDPRIPVWEATHQLMRALKTGGVDESGRLLARLPGRADAIRQLAYRLYTLCERKGWAEEARVYNELICSWGETVTASEKAGIMREQMPLNL